MVLVTEDLVVRWPLVLGGHRNVHCDHEEGLGGGGFSGGEGGRFAVRKELGKLRGGVEGGLGGGGGGGGGVWGVD